MADYELSDAPDTMLTSDPSSILRRQYLASTGGPVEFLLIAFQRYIESLSDIIQAKLPTKTGSFIITNVRVVEPRVAGSHGTSVSIFPTECLKQSISYLSEVYVDVIHEVDGHVSSTDTVCLGKTPVMVRSNLCNLTRYTGSDDLYKSMPNDPGGYFVIGGSGNGGEKVVMLQTRLLPHQDVIYYEGKNLGNYMICLDDYSTKKVGVVIYDKAKNSDDKTTRTQMIHVLTASLGSAQTAERTTPGVNIGTIYTILGMTSEDVLEYIDYFIPINTPKREVVRAVIREFLQKTFDNSIQDKANALQYVAARDKTTATLVNTNKMADAVNLTEHNLLADLFPQIPAGDVVHKIDMLTYMMVRLALVYKGFEPLDDRDNHKSVHLQTSPSMMTTLVSQIWRETLRQLKTRITQQELQNNAVTSGAIKNVLMEYGSITEPLVSAIVTGKWGTKTTRASWYGITQDLARMSIAATYSDLNRINTPAVKRGSQTKARQLRGSHAMMKCMAQTPDTEAIGLVANLASLAKTSVDRPGDDIIIRQMLEGLPDDFGGTPGEGKHHQVIINGRPVGWGTGRVLQQFLLQQRRRGHISYDVGIALTPFALFIKTIAGRLYFPALIVEPPMNNQAVGRLMYDVIAEELGRNPTYDELMSRGGAEFIDSHELENATTAQTLEEYRRKVDDQQGMLNELSMIQSQLSQLGGTRRTRPKVEIPGEDLLGAQLEAREQDLVQQFAAAKRPYTPRTIDRAFILTNMRQIVSDRLVRLNKNTRYTHVVLDPTAIFGVAASMTPKPDMMQGPRIGFQCQMASQAITTPDINANQRFDNESKTLISGQAPMFYTQQAQDLGNDFQLSGEHVILAIAPWNGYNVEDAIVFNQASVDRGMFMQSNYHTIKASESESSGISEWFYRPLPGKRDTEDVYKYIEDDGIVEVGVRVKEGDCLVGIAKFTDANRGSIDKYLQQVNYIHSINDQIKLLQTTPSDQPEAIKLQADIERVQRTDPTHALRAIQLGLQQRLDELNVLLVDKDPSLAKERNQLRHALARNKAQPELQERLVEVDAMLTQLKPDPALVQERKEVKRALAENEVEQEMAKADRLTELKNLKKQLSTLTLTPTITEKIKELQQTYKVARDVLDTIPAPENVSVYVGWDEAGVVDAVQITNSETSKHVVKIRIRNLHKPSSGFGGGDKYAPRFAQKMTVSRTYSADNMPFFNLITGYHENGDPIVTSFTPDAIANPACLPSRMTVALLMELLTGNVNGFYGTRTDATAFRYIDPKLFMQELVKLGYNIEGKAHMYNPITGKRMTATIAVGPVHYQALKHQVEDKIRVRGEGQYDPVTGQPLRGRKRKGGLHFGEMERDCVLSLGAAGSLLDRLSADSRVTVWCQECGVKASLSSSTESGFECKQCHGQRFGKMNIPAGFNYAIQLLAGIGITVQLKFTSDTIGKYNFLTKTSPTTNDINPPAPLCDTFRPKGSYIQNALDEMINEWQTLDINDTIAPSYVDPQREPVDEGYEEYYD